MTGPLFDGRAAVAAANMTLAVRREMAKEGVALAAAAFNGAIRQNNGVFVGSITVTDTSRTYSTGGGHNTYTMNVSVPTDCSVVTSSIVSYGPWLEGVGSRNDSTRFKGYHGFQMAAQELEARATTVADTVTLPYVEEMN